MRITPGCGVLMLALLCAAAPLLAADSPQAAPSAPASGPDSDAYSLSGTLASGAQWKARVPRHWNGTLLLYSHGYSPTLRPPELAPPQHPRTLALPLPAAVQSRRAGFAHVASPPHL